MCSVPSMCSRMRPTARVASPRRRSWTSERCCSFEWVRTWSGWAIRPIRSRHRALDLGHLGDEPRRARASRQARCESGCRRAGSPRSRRPPPCGRRARRAGRGPAASARSHARSVAPVSIATRCSSTDHAASPSGSGSTPDERRLLDDEGASAPPALGDEEARLRERRQRLAKRRARDPKLARRARARAAASAPGASRPSRIAVPSRSTVSSKVVGGRTGWKTASRAASRSIAPP